MKNKLFALTAVLAFASCQKQSIPVNNVNDEVNVNNVLYAEIDSSATKTSLYDGVKTKWTANDQFRAFDNAGNSVVYKYVSENMFEPVEGTKTGAFNIKNFAAAYYPASKIEATGYNISASTLTVSVPATQTYAEGTFAANSAPLASKLITTIDNKKTISFKNAFAVVKVPVKYTAGHEHFAPVVDYISLTSATTKLNGTFTLTLSGENTVSVGAGNGTNTITLENCTSAGAMGTTEKDFYIVVPALQDNEKITVYVNNGVTKRASTTANRTSDNANPLKQNNILTMPALTVFDDGTVNGEFSVSANQKVYFSQGNLQYRAYPADWRFAPDQTTVVGSGNSSYTQGGANPNYLDLFCFGASGCDNAHLPYAESATVSTSINGTNYDWGVNNGISNGGNVANLWRTLTLAEWDYLFKRTHGFAYATVNGVIGVIVFPDGYNTTGIVSAWPEYYQGSYNRFPNQWRSTPNSQTFTNDAWAKLESTGCVFIPACGVRVGKTITYQSSAFTGNYWTSTHSACTWPIAGGGLTGQPKGDIARYFYMVNSKIEGDSQNYYYFRTGESNGNSDYAFAVRLARNVN